MEQRRTKKNLMKSNIALEGKTNYDYRRKKSVIIKPY